MNPERFNETVLLRQLLCRRILGVKADEYSPDGDRLSNFKAAAALQGMTPLGALGGMMVKHVVAFYDFIRTDEKDWKRWEEKLTDLHNYLYLAEALLIEGGDHKR